MRLAERPRLRPTISGQIDPQDERFIILYDTYRISKQMLRVGREALALLQLFDGERSLHEMQRLLNRQTSKLNVPIVVLQQIAETLEAACFLEGARLEAHLEEFRKSPIREPVCIGTYAGDPEELHNQLSQLFLHPRGAGWPQTPPQPDGSLAGALIPHIDYHRGGTTYTWGFRELVERSDADLFVILATSHFSGHRFILTPKHFRTPLGVAETDLGYVRRVAELTGPKVFEDEIAHLPEHAIELHVVFLQYCLEKLHRPFKIVPILVGPFHDCIAAGRAPVEQPDIAVMIDALRTASAEAEARGARICYLCSGDLAHIGPKFGDAALVQDVLLQFSLSQDRALINRLEAADARGFFQVLAEEDDARRICGFPPCSLLLNVLQPEQGKLLDYRQYVEPRGLESVSFASVGFYKTPGAR